jgi:tRNA modification GTPase
LVEKIGIEKAFEQARKADVIFYIVDSTAPEDSLETRLDYLLKSAPQAKIFICLNKSDLTPTSHIQDRLSTFDCPVFYISAKTKGGLDALLGALKEHTSWANHSATQTIVTNARHADALHRSAVALEKSIDAVELSIPGDLLAQDLRLALDALGEVTGTISTDDLLANIFSKFCIGK